MSHKHLHRETHNKITIFNILGKKNDEKIDRMKLTFDAFVNLCYIQLRKSL